MAKLTPEQRAEIRAAPAGTSARELAKRYGISRQAVDQLRAPPRFGPPRPRGRPKAPPQPLEPIEPTEFPHAQMKLTAEQVETIRAAPPEVLTRHLARRYGVSDTVVSRIRRGLQGNGPRQEGPHPLASVDVAGMAARGMSDPEIAAEVGVTTDVVRQWRRRHGIPAGLPWTRA